MILVQKEIFAHLACKDPVRIECDYCTVIFAKSKKYLLSKGIGKNFQRRFYCCTVCSSNAVRILFEKPCLECLVKLTKYKFCSRSCGAKFTNRKRGFSVHYCKRCNKGIPYGKVCKSCRKPYKEEQMMYRFENGLISDRTCIKKILLKNKNCCFECGLKTWRRKVLPLEVDHMDGNPANDFPNNLRLLCPNCHSITNTWKGKNKGKGRKSRGLPLY